MNQFDDITSFLEENETATEQPVNGRRRWLEPEVSVVRNNYPGVPEDYLAYLAEVGSGAVLDCQYVVYDGFLELNEIFADEQVRCIGKRILCVGDNFCGDPVGFLPDENWLVVEVWHDSLSVHPAGLSFGQFIREQIFFDDA